MSTKRIISDTLYYGVIPKLAMLINVVLLPIITPYLTTDDYGIQGIVSSYASLFLAIAPMGLHVHLSNSYFEYPKDYRKIWGRMLFLFLVLGMIFGLLNMIVLAVVLPKMSWGLLLLLCFVGSIQIFLFSNGVLAQTLFPLIEHPRPLVFTNLAASCMGIAVSFLLIYYYKLGYWGLVSPVAVSSLVSFAGFGKLVCYDYDIKPIIERNKRRLIEFFRISLPLVPHALGFALLSSSARIIMSIHHVPYEEIGLFSHGCIMGDYAIIITTALGTAIALPIQRSYRAKDYQSFRKLYFLCQGVALVISSLFCIWMPEIYGILIQNEQLRLSANIASLICFANVVMPLYSFMSSTAFIEKRTKQILWLVFLPGTINLLLCLVLMPIFGYRVAVYAAILSYWSQMTIPFFVKYYKTTVNAWLGNRRKIVFLFLIMFSALLFSNMISGGSLLLRIIVSLGIVSVFTSWYVKFKINEII